MSTEEDRWVGARIAAARRLANLTTRQLADRLGWSDHSRIANYESGRRSVSVVALIAIARALGLPAAALFGESPEEQAIIAYVAGHRERAQQLAYMIAMLEEPEPEAPNVEPAPGSTTPPVAQVGG